MYNPRWPHTFRVVVESLDQNGIPVTDANGDPVVGSMQLEKIGDGYAVGLPHLHGRP